jgi:hypothetical protein
MQTSIEMLIEQLAKNIVPTDKADAEDLARNGAFHIAINFARTFEQREKDLILSAFDSQYKGTAEEFFDACFNQPKPKKLVMSIENALEIAQHYQDWRTGKIDEIEYQGKAITEALNILIEKAKE